MVWMGRLAAILYVSLRGYVSLRKCTDRAPLDDTMGDARFVPGGKIAGKYSLLCEFGSGGMSDIWLAKNDATDAEVVLKVARGCKDGENDSLILRERFRNEARACAKLGHPNIVRVFDLIEDDGASMVLVMERLHGCTLSDCIAVKGKIAPASAVAIMLGLLAGLEHAHGAGLIHRDIKPENVFLAVDPDGLVTPKMLDFGVAKFPSAKNNLTLDGLILGTPQYMSPEQVRAQKLDVRSDVFALGTVLYEILTGTSPFEAETTSAALAAVLERQPERIDFVPAALWEVLARTLDKNPANRPASAAILGKELREAVGVDDAVLAAALENLVPSTLPDSRRSLDSARIVLRPPGASVRPPSLLESQKTLNGKTLVISSPTPPALRASRSRMYWLIAPLAVAVAVGVVGLLAMGQGAGAGSTTLAAPSGSALVLEQHSGNEVGSNAGAPRAERTASVSTDEPQAAAAPSPILPGPSASATPRRGRRAVALTPGF